MGLEPVILQEVAEEGARRKTKTTLEMGKKDYPLLWTWQRRDLARRRDAALHPRRNAARFPRPLDVGLRDDGALPGSPPLELELAGGGGGFVHNGGLRLLLVSHGDGGASRCRRREDARKRTSDGSAHGSEEAAAL